MDNYNCDICNIAFTSAPKYNRHLQSKKHNMKMTGVNTFVCTVCDKSFKQNSSLSRHKRSCKVNVFEIENEKLTNENGLLRRLAQEIELREKIQSEANKEKEEMQKKINELTDKCGQTTNIGTQNINITINAFGNENLDYITKNDCKRIVSRVFFSAVEAAKLIYFNKDHPENHTVKIPNKKYPHALIMGKDKKWEMVNRAETIQKMASKSCNVVGDSFDRIYNEISGFQKARMQDFFHKMDMRDEEVMKQIEKEIDSNTLAYTRGSS